MKMGKKESSMKKLLWKIELFMADIKRWFRFIKFLRHSYDYFMLEDWWGLNAHMIDFALGQYQEILTERTKDLSKLNYYADTVIEHMDEWYDWHNSDDDKEQ